MMVGPGVGPIGYLSGGGGEGEGGTQLFLVSMCGVHGVPKVGSRERVSSLEK